MFSQFVPEFGWLIQLLNCFHNIFAAANIGFGEEEKGRFPPLLGVHVTMDA